jgi:hypothetical protein
MPTPVTIVDSGGIPVTNSTLGAPFTPVESGGIPITLVDDGGMPMALVNEDLSAWTDGVTYDADAEAYFAAMSVEPDATRKGLLNDLIVGLKADSIWAKLLGLWVFAAHDEQAARVNAKTPAQVLTAVNSPAFTTDRSYAGDGATSYLATSFTGGSITRSDWTMAVLVDVATATSLSGIMGYVLNAGELRASTASNGTRARMGTATSSTSTTVGANDQFIAGRRTGTNQSIVMGTSIEGAATVTDSSSGAANVIDILRVGTNHTNAALQHAVLASYLDDTEILNLRTRLRTYSIAVGAI